MKSKVDYVLMFRRAKSEVTLEKMFDRMYAEAADVRDQANMVLALCQREREIQQGRRLDA
jgi:hypothetical protein